MKIASVIYVIFFLMILGGYIYFRLDKKPDIPGVIPKEELPANFPENKVVASWLWQSPYNMDENTMAHYINKASEEGINTIYIDVGQYIDLTEQPDKEKAAYDLGQFNEKYVQFLKLATEKNIKVEAMAGGPDWANEDHKYLPPLIINYVHDFNSKNRYKYSGIHFDIESWNGTDFNDRKTEGYTEYLAMIRDAMDLNTELNSKHSTDLKLAFDISYWLDNQNDNVPGIVWNGQMKYPLFHLLDILNRESGHKIVIMAYRNVALGKDGSTKHSKEELDFIRDNNMNIEVLIGQETSENPTEKITFYGMGKDKLKLAADEINEYYKDYPQFKGIAIHNLDSYLDL